MKKTNNIIVGVDYAPYSRHAIEVGASIAKKENKNLKIIHVIYPEVVSATVMYSCPSITNKEFLAKAEKRLKKFISKVLKDKNTLEIKSEVILGHPFYEIFHSVEKEKAELLILGAHSSKKSRHPTGPVATKCVRKAPCKVMLIANNKNEYKRIVVAVDFSKTSRLALKEAIRLAKENRARLGIVHVYGPPWLSTIGKNAGIGNFPSEFGEKYFKNVQKSMNKFLKPFQKELKGVDHEIKLTEKYSEASGVIDYLKEAKADLVVLGTRGRTKLELLLIGSTAEHIIRDIPCSVLAIKPEGFVYHARGT